MRDIKQKLEEKYSVLFQKHELSYPLEARKINGIIRDALRGFLKNAVRPAIYCNGGHTQMLMADFIYELKKVKYIVDNYAASGENTGFFLIRDHELEEKEIDAIILSTFKFRENLKRDLEEKHPDIPVLDIYDELEKYGLKMQADYYYSNHPYHNYHSINFLQREIGETTSAEKLKKLYKELITKYIHIKDFRTALLKVQELAKISSTAQLEELEKDLTELYELEKQAAGSVSENNVLMLCLDGLRYRDLSERNMPKLEKILDETAYSFKNVYSFSTSTYESLIPVYSENHDLRTRYFEKNVVDAEKCRFAELAKKQKRSIYIYGDMDHFIEGENICYSDSAQTVTEKFWDFLIDSNENDNGLFYVHELYESHFTFSNPYTSSSLKSEGTALLFDFLPMKGGCLRADYKQQHQDAIHYLDDVLAPFLERLSCRMVLYADHGTLILEKEAKLSEVGNTEYTCSEGWTRIPMAIRSPETGVGKNSNLISLMEVSSIIISLLNKEDYIATAFQRADHIKIARSELYNPDFRFLYEMIGKEQYLQAFECFVFEDGYKLIIFEDGYTELYLLQGDKDAPVENNQKKEKLLREVREEITVCSLEKIRLF